MGKFFSCKQDYHYVGKVRSVGMKLAGETEKVTAQYFRRVHESFTGFYVFNDPEFPDIYDTPWQQVVGKIAKIVKRKLHYDKFLFGKEVAR